MGELFGTDGIRGIANEHPMTVEMAVNIGRAAAFLFRKSKKKSSIIIGKDTRISGDMIEHALVSGICSMGTDAYLAGIIPTPGVAFITSSTDSTAGVVISASHNPFYDNGIKIFKEDGQKLSDEIESEIEHLVQNGDIHTLCKSVRKPGTVYKIDDAVKRYSDFLVSTLPKSCSLQGVKIVIDCSNGATYKIAPEIFKKLGADVETLFDSPDGENINENCGSQHPEALKKRVVETGADIGLAFDGDGDRLIAVNEKGDILTGDQILAICAKDMKLRGALKNNTVVSTIMSNMGLGTALKEMNIDHVKTKVGDRHVLEKMLSAGAVLGGEESGHMIFLDYHTTGDGILAGLRLVEAMSSQLKPLSELAEIIHLFPQVLINVEVTKKPDIREVPVIVNKIESVESCMGEKGRVLVRYSGTQPLCRIMVEGPDIDEIRKHCQQIADIVNQELGKCRL